MKPHTILIVDDEETVHNMVTANLIDYSLVHAYNGWQALQELERESIDVVLLDINMPGRTGFQVLNDICTRPGAPPVVMCSAETSPRIANQAIEQGAHSFLDKSAETYQSLSSHLCEAYDDFQMAIDRRQRIMSRARDRERQVA